MSASSAPTPDRTQQELRREPQHLVVFVSGVFHSAYDELLPAFEEQSSVKVDSYLSPSMGKSSDSVTSRLERGEPADVLIMAAAGLEHVISLGLAIPDTIVALASAPIGIAVKAGTAKPDISTTETLITALLAADTVAYSISASGKYVSEELFKKLGIESQMSNKAHQVEGTTPVAEMVANGTYELGFQSLSELGAVEGVELVGALPEPVARSTQVAGAVAVHSQRPRNAEALLRFLSGPEHEPSLKRHGLETATQR